MNPAATVAGRTPAVGFVRLMQAVHFSPRTTSTLPVPEAPSRASRDPFANGEMGLPAILRAPFGGRFIGVMELSRDDRGFSLIAAPTRCIRRGDVHELILTDEQGAAPGTGVQRCRFLGFVEFESAGVMVRGDAVEIDGRQAGVVAGFDECHFPNHLNIVLQADVARTGIELGLRPGASLVVRPRSGNHLADRPALKDFP